MKVLRVWLFLILALPTAVWSATLPEKIDSFLARFKLDESVQTYDMRIIESNFPTRLLSPEYMLPQTALYPLQDIQQLYKLAQTCTGKLPLSPLVTEPLVFVRAMCRGTPISEKWFARTALIHPGGGTYAARYVQENPNAYQRLRHYMHIQERPLAAAETLLGKLQRMDSKALAALLSGSRMFIDEGNFWLRAGDKYYLFAENTWSRYLESSEISVRTLENGETCLVRRGNLCIEEQDESNILRQILYGLVILNLLLIFSWAFHRWNTKRQELRSRMLVLQILTHELRTPIASLSLTVEGFRREFDHLPESVYADFRRLCEDTRRLRQLAEASKDYLQSDHQTLVSEWIPSLKTWLEYRLEESSEPVKLTIDSDLAVKVNIYWLGNCLDNLISNAAKYGAAPIEITVEGAADRVFFRVIDQGSLTAKDWNKLKKPFVSEAGLGLGLTIVDSMVKRMGGRLSLIGPPTTFILEIPCETDSATY